MNIGLTIPKPSADNRLTFYAKSKPRLKHDGVLYLELEATGGFEPPNRGFADPRLRPLGYVALKPLPYGAEEEI